MKAFALFLLIVGLFLFLSIIGVFNFNFRLIVEIIFAIFFGVEGIRELTKRNFIGIGGIIFSVFLFTSIFEIFGYRFSLNQTFVALIASYLIGIGIHILLKKTITPNFWEKW
ncbi:MAG: hypothetical protein ACP5F2_03775 [Athalassotoga sp.]|uniref:hypothetical protein n=1 Tax=Athalassotoga sp. TaxID=2022597 RepID=UPI003CFE78FB